MANLFTPVQPQLIHSSSVFQTTTHTLYVHITHTTQVFTDAVHQECYSFIKLVLWTHLLSAILEESNDSSLTTVMLDVLRFPDDDRHLLYVHM